MAAPLTVEQTAAALQAAQATTTGTATGTGTASQPSGGVAGTSTDGGGGGPSSGLDPLEGHPPYVSWEERREPSERKPPRKSTGHSYCVKFFLVDTSGVEYLAAVGEDQGDAHYLYEHRAGFPFLRANNKGEVRSWLESIIGRSKDRAGVHGHLVQDPVPQDPNQIRLPKFVGHSQEKQELPDGRHRIEWYLLDECDDSHLAVVGEEKETRDGHYLYRTQGIFDQALPLSVGNQREVERWIDVMVFHGGVAPALPFAKADSFGGHGGASAGRAASDASAMRGGSRAGARPHAASHQRAAGGGGGGLKHDLLKQATSNAKRQKTQLGRQGLDPDSEAREVVAQEVQRWGQEEAQRREVCKRQALAYATDPLAGKEAAAAKRCLAVLRQAADKASFLPGAGAGGGGGGGSATRGGSGGSHQQQANLVEVLAALRELGHMYAPLSLVAMPELKECLGRLQAHARPEVSQLAHAVLERWLRVAVAQAQVLTDPRYVQDPRSVLEAVLSSRDSADPLVSSITHRKLPPRPKESEGRPGTGRPPTGPAAGLSGAHARGGSRLGGAAGAASAAMLGASAAETPAGLLSEQSLGGLMGSGELGGSMSLPMDIDGGGATVERRRLDLNALDSPAAVLTAAGMRRQGQALSTSSSGEEEEEEAAAAAARASGGAASNPSSAPPSSSLADMMVPGDSQALGVPRRHGAGAGAASGALLANAASVDLIEAPISAVESEQAEMLPATGDGA